MKKIILGTITAVMLLTGCGAGKETPDNHLQTLSGNMTAGQEETTEQMETQPETKGAVRAEFSYDKIYMSVELPDGWKYEIKEYDAESEDDRCGIIFGPEGQEDLRYELYYHSSYGICATGVAIEELRLENGMHIWRYTEKINNTIWRDIVFDYEKSEEEKGTYVLMCSADEKLVTEYEEELDEILETIVVGK